MHYQMVLLLRTILLFSAYREDERGASSRRGYDARSVCSQSPPRLGMAWQMATLRALVGHVMTHRKALDT